jgi:UDP-N-acetylglucosamine 2-epimerase
VTPRTKARANWRKLRNVFIAINKWKRVRNDVLLYGTHNYEFRKTFNVLYQHETNQQHFDEMKKKKKLAEIKNSTVHP